MLYTPEDASSIGGETSDYKPFVTRISPENQIVVVSWCLSSNGRVNGYRDDSMHRSVYGSIRELTTFRSSLAKHLLNNDTNLPRVSGMNSRGNLASVMKNFTNVPTLSERVDNNVNKTNRSIKMRSPPPPPPRMAKLTKVKKNTHPNRDEQLSLVKRKREETTKRPGQRRLYTGNVKSAGNSDKDHCNIPSSEPEHPEESEEEHPDDRHDEEQQQEHQESEEEQQEEENEGDEEDEDKSHCKDEDGDENSEEARQDNESANESFDEHDLKFNEVFKPFSSPSFPKMPKIDWLSSGSNTRPQKLPTSYARFTKYVADTNEIRHPITRVANNRVINPYQHKTT